MAAMFEERRIRAQKGTSPKRNPHGRTNEFERILAIYYGRNTKSREATSAFPSPWPCLDLILFCLG